MEKPMTRNVLTKLGLLRVVLVAGVGLLLTIATSARAQDPDPAAPAAPAAAAPAPAPAPANPPPEATAERVIVTGSNIPTAEEVGANPVLTLNRDVIQKAGVRTVEELLERQVVINANQIPVQNNGTSQSGPAGTSTVALRGFDTGATLVLVNGLRVAPFPGSGFVDLNNYPQAILESVEILKQGASAVYGADAQAGVINFKTWKDYRGVQATVEYGNVLDKNAARYLGDVLFGVGDDKTSINGDIFYYHHNSTFNQDYGNSANPPFLSSNSSPWNLQVTQAAAFAAGAGTIGGTAVNEYVSPTGNTNGLQPANQYLFSGGRIHFFNFNAYSSSFPEQERWGGYASFAHKICDDQVQIYGDFLYNDSKTHDELAPIATGSFQTPGNPVIAVPPHSDLNGTTPYGGPTYAATGLDPHAYNPFNPFDEILSGGTRARIFDFGNRLINNEAYNWMTTLGVKGDKLFDGNWGYDAAFRYSQTNLTSQIQTASGSRFAQILDANSSIHDPNAFNYIGTTAAYDPFYSFRHPLDPSIVGSNAANVQYARADIRDLSKSSVAETSVNVYTVDLFDLPAGGVGLAFGGQWAREEYKFNPDDQNAKGDQLGVGVAPYSNGGRKTYAFYAETTIPIFSPSMGVWGLHNLEFDAAGRFEDFRNNNTNVLVPRVALRWQPFDEQLTLRASWGEGFLEPQLFELYAPPSFTLAPTSWNGNAEPETTYAVYSNRNLQPGDSRDFTGGFVYTPKWMPSGQTLTFSAEFWGIERTGVVTQPSAQEVVNRFRAGKLLPGEIVQLSGPPNDPNTSVNFVQSSFFNSGKQKGKGVDLTLLYQYQTPNWGTFTWTTQATYLESFIFQLDSMSKPHEVSGRANNDPFEGAFFGQVTAGDGWLKWKGVSTLDWAWHNFDFSFTEHYWDGFKEEFLPEGVYYPGSPERDHYVSQTWFSDIEASYTLLFTPPVESQPVAGYSKDSKEVMTGKEGKQVETMPYEMPCWKTILNNSTLTFGVTNLFGQDPPQMYGFFFSNANNYPGSLYDNLGRFYYLRLTKKF
jgi:iron complex outermembrane receptor protein